MAEWDEENKRERVWYDHSDVVDIVTAWNNETEVPSDGDRWYDQRDVVDNESARYLQYRTTHPNTVDIEAAWKSEPEFLWDVYLIGSLRNPTVVEVHKWLEGDGLKVFSSWYAAGPRADDCWKEYEQALGHSYIEAINGPAAQNVLAFDKRNLLLSRAAVLVYPAGRSGHLELGYHLGHDRAGFVLHDGSDERWDVMLGFATAVVDNVPQLVAEIKEALK